MVLEIGIFAVPNATGAESTLEQIVAADRPGALSTSSGGWARTWRRA